MKLLLVAADGTVTKLVGPQPPSPNPNVILLGEDAYVHNEVQPDPRRVQYYRPATVVRVKP